MQVPLLEDADDLPLAPLLRHEQHALLRLGEHHLVSGHPGLALRDLLNVDLDAGARARPHLGGRAGESGRAHVLDADHGAGGEGFQAGLEQHLLHERVAHLDGGPAFLAPLPELGGGHGRAVDPVPSRLGAHVEDGVAHALRAAKEDLARFHEPEAEGVHQRVLAVAVLEHHLSPHGGTAEGVAVAADPGDDPRKQATVLRIGGRPEAQGVQDRDGPRAHGEDVAQDPAHPGGRPLVGLDERRVVVRLDLEDRAEAVPDVHRPRVLPRPLNDARPLRGQRAQMLLAALVRAVFGPHDREEPELGPVGLPAQGLHDPVVFVAGQVVLDEGFGAHGHI